MRVKQFLFVLFCCMWQTSFCQTEEPVKRTAFLEVLHNLPPAIGMHIPAGYLALDTTYGNLNMDSIPDLILVVKSPAEDTAGFGEEETGHCSYCLEMQTSRISWHIAMTKWCCVLHVAAPWETPLWT